VDEPGMNGLMASATAAIAFERRSIAFDVEYD
jgi:hypothetical protein